MDSYDLLVLTCIACSISKVRAAVRSVLRGAQFIPTFQERADELNLQTIYAGAPPRGGAHLIKLLLYAPASAPASTVFVANMEDGWATMVNCLSEILASTAVVRITTSRQDVAYPFNSFKVLEGGDSKRIVMAYKDGTDWRFFESGPRLSFEQAQFYKRRRIRDRLTREIIVSYLSSFKQGWRIDRDLFWQSRQACAYFEQCRS